MKQDLLSPLLFGNEAGEDEDIEILNSYFVEKPEFKPFYDPLTKIQIVRSRKGLGKSALLKRGCYGVAKSDSILSIYLKGSDLIALQDTDMRSPHSMVYGWQQRICSRATLEIGKHLDVALNDDSITLVESAELAGFRGRNLVGCLVDRLRLKLKSVEIDFEKMIAADKQQLLSRFTSTEGIQFWLFIDDIDATFLNREDQRLLISTFFSACRNIVNEVEGLRIRASVRTDVWSVLTQYDEAMDKCEQYMVDISWSTRETGMILKRKILSYFQRTYPRTNELKMLDSESVDDEKRIFDLVFKTPFKWGSRYLGPDKPMHILSAGRPRWSAQLCKLAGKHAVSRGYAHISVQDVSRVMDAYGRSRLNDLYKEHGQQCDSMSSLIESFAGMQKRFTTAELLQAITDRIIKRRGLPTIDGIKNSGDSIYIAHFLFQIGFIYGRNDRDETGLSFVKHDERPHLLLTTANLDDDLIWEIHPSYRTVLKIK